MLKTMESGLFTILWLILLSLLLDSNIIHFSNASDLNIDIPKKFRKNIELSSLFCNTCAVIGDKLTDIASKPLSEDDFELNVGFRMDSQGNKIRKNNKETKKLMAMVLELHDICDNKINKHHYSVAKRKQTGYYYLISKDRIREINDENSDKNEELNDEILLKIEAKFESVINEDGFDWETKMSRIPFESPIDNETEMEVTFEQKKEYFIGMMKFDYENEFAPKHYLNYKPKLLKKKENKEFSKLISEMCYLISESMDEWLQLFDTNKFSDDSNSAGVTSDSSNGLEIDFDNFCIDEMHGLCLKEMLNTKEELIKMKVARERHFNVPQKPKPQKRPQPEIDNDYTEDIEDDNDNDSENNDNGNDNDNNEGATTSNSENDENERETAVAADIPTQAESEHEDGKQEL